MAQSAPAGQPLVAETLARYATSLKYEDLPPDVVRVAKRIIIDSIGCGIGAFSAETSQIANKLAAGVSAVRGATVLCSGVKTSPSIGVAVYPDHGTVQDRLYKSADLALYEAKRMGGNTWCWYRTRMAGNGVGASTAASSPTAEALNRRPG